MPLSRRQFLRAAALLPCLALPDLAWAQEPEHTAFLPLITKGQPMSDFPCTGILDNFNRADGPLGANWHDDDDVGVGLIIESNQIRVAVGDHHSASEWDTLVGPDCEVYVGVPVWGTQSAVSLFARYDDVTGDGFELIIVPATGVVNIQLFANGIQIAGSLVPTEAGDRYGMRCCGSTVSVYQDRAGVGWNQTPVFSLVNTSVVAAGYIGLMINGDVNDLCRLDNFGGGTIGVECCGQPWTPTALPVTTKCAEDPVLALVCANGDRLDLITWEAGFELDDPGWRPQVAQFKGGGSYADSQIAEGSTLVAGEYANVTETIPLVARGTSEAACIKTYRRLQQFIKRASDYWKEPSEYDDVWLEVRPAGLGCRTGYARVVKAACVDFANSYGQPFYSPQPLSVADGLSLVVEREPLWRAVPPGEMIGPLYNLLKNPDFEEWNAGVADSQPDCWSDLELIGVTGTNGRDTTPKWGRYAFKVDVTGSTGANQAKGVTQTVEGTEDGQTYTVVAWVRSEGVTNGVGRLLVTHLLGQYEVYRGASRHGWTLYTKVFTTGVSDVVGVNCEILSTAAGCDGTVYFDSLMVLKGDWEQEAIDGMLPYMSSSHILNHWDQTGGIIEAGAINYVDCWEVPGDHDALVRLEFQNWTSGQTYSKLRIGQRRSRDVQNYKLYFDPPGLADATASSGTRSGTGALNDSWKTISTQVVTGGDVLDNLGRFRLLARIWDEKASGDPNMQVRLHYALGTMGVGESYLDAVTAAIRSNWCIADVTPNKAVNFDTKFMATTPSQIGCSLDFRRPVGAEAGRLDYIMALPTDGGCLFADMDPGLSFENVLAADNTASMSITASYKKSDWRLFYDAGGAWTRQLKVFKGELYFLNYDLGTTGAIFKLHGGVITQVFSDAFGAVQSLEIFNDELYASQDDAMAGGNARIWKTSDGVTWTIAMTLAAETSILRLRAFAGSLWVSAFHPLASWTIHQTNGSAVLGSMPFAGATDAAQPYRNKLYFFIEGGPGIWSWEASTGAWKFEAVLNHNLSGGNSTLVYQDKLYYGGFQTATNCGEVVMFDGTTWNVLLSVPGGANMAIEAIREISGVLYVIFVGRKPMYSEDAGLTWHDLEGHTPTAGWDLETFEGQLYLADNTALYIYIPEELSFYKVADYQGGAFTAPNRRLLDDERRHRWFFSYDRSDGSNVIGDRARVGLGFVPRYLSLLGEG